jgi:multidrug efflux pump
MKLVEACIKNKLIVYILTLALCLVGLFSIYTVTISPFPSIKFNIFLIDLNYPGANAQTVQKQVVNEISTRLESIDDLQYILANASGGSAHIELGLGDDTSQDQLLQAQMQVMQAISASNLPASVQQPKISQASGGSGLIRFIVTSDKANMFDLNNFIKSKLYSKFSSLPGVQLRAFDSSPVVKISLSPMMLAKYQLNPQQVFETINQNYKSSPLGSVYIDKQQYILNVADNFNSLNALKNLIIGYSSKEDAQNNKLVHGVPIYLKDIAKVSFTSRDIVDQSFMSYNGVKASGIVLLTETNSNPFFISKASRAYVDSIKDNLPDDIKISATSDMSKIMKSAMTEVAFTILIAAILVLFVALIFLGRLKTTIIPIITIPVCLLGSMIFVNFLGFSLNLLTLLAMVIAVGLVVDDAIVVVENITRYIEQGFKKKDAIVQGTSDISLTIVGITLTLLAVYIPVVFSAGSTAGLIKPFALTLASSVFISGIIALTLTPVMACSFICTSAPNGYQKSFEKLLHKIIDGYHFLLKGILKIPKISLLIIIALVFIGGFYAVKLPKQVFPNDPDSEVAITITGASTDDVNSLKEKINLFSKFYNNDKVSYYTSQVDKDPISGILTANVWIHYKMQYLRQNEKFTEQINAFIKKNNISNASAKMSNFTNWGEFDLQFTLYGGSNINQVNKEARQITNLMKKSPMFLMVSNRINKPQKQLSFDIDSVKSSRVGISREDITQALSTYYGGSQLSNYFSIAGLSVPVVVQMSEDNLKDVSSVDKIQIKSDLTGKYYPLTEFVSVKLTAEPLMISTFNNQPSVTINANLNKGYDLGKAIPFVNDLVKKNAPQMQLSYSGNAQSYLKGNAQTIWIAILGIACVYFLLAILFKSIVDPFVIMLTVPFCVIGGALSLYLIGGTLNIYSTVGLITLVGLITKHGVLIVQFANDELKKGSNVKDAVLLATHHRFRPIIMTTLAMVFGALPLLFSSGMMYVSRENLGIVIIGGLIIGTFFSLFIVPLVYTLVKKAEHIK